MPHPSRFALPLLAALCAVTPATAQVRFNRDVRPILSDRCYACHGPDAKNKNIPLRLDSFADATADLGKGRRAIVPGSPAASTLVARIQSPNKALRMPPLSTGHALKPAEIETLTRWIAEGAKWEKHWSYLPPERPAPPRTAFAGRERNAIDNFVFARLERESLSPAPEADRARLLRRLSLDLTGLPPTPAEIDAFLADPSEAAYTRTVDRLLASPAHAETLASRWLDAARYADTNGYQTDGERSMWRWRDWVLNAFQSNMPFDQFTIEQLAGDQLPNATLPQRSATGFHRNHRGNGEGGIVQEEYLAEYAADRVETTAMVWLGTTMGCARCHNHKYDPFSQKEFYQLYSYFSNIPERGRYFKFGNTPPLVPAPTPDDEAKLTAVDARLAAAEQRWNALRGRAGEPAAGAIPAAWSTSRGRLFHAALNRKFDGTKFHDAGSNAALVGYFDRFTLAARFTATSPNGAIVTRAKLEQEPTGWGIELVEGKLRVYLSSRWLDDALHVETAAPVTLNQPHHVTVTYDASRVASGILIYVDGKLAPTKTILDELNQEFRAKEPIRIGGGGGLREPAKSYFQGTIDEVWVYGRLLEAPEVAQLANPSLPEARRSAWLEDFAAPEVREAYRAVLDLREERAKLVRSFPTVMVMHDNPTPPKAHVLLRGAYDKPGPEVTPALPAALTTNPAPSRLALARWMVSRDNPLTARVIVNRYWQMIFGTGLVKTVEDFGSQGEWPSHPELLDWLAVEFMDSGWDVRHLLKTIVTSSTYRQSSRVAPELVQRDPENRLLARGSRTRLPAEIVRDQALAIAGLLDRRVGGPSVKPYQPDGLWKELSGMDYKQDHGADLYRRSLYTFWRRTSPPPAMMNFDAAGREVCSVRSSRTNTPLQALNLMNDVQFLEAARFLGQRMVREGGATAQDRLRFGFRLATARFPNERELGILAQALAHHRDRYASDAAAAEKLLAQGEGKRDASLAAADHAAFMTVASMILNLDEVVTKE
ncbi:MAG: DUF1553 domain-containing protein [Bryobacterales bacterium]|nr:DUF1553 domain-containing protein [Bryobacterales bacterium]